jgi:hypothetical protein
MSLNRNLRNKTRWRPARSVTLRTLCRNGIDVLSANILAAAN